MLFVLFYVFSVVILVRVTIVQKLASSLLVYPRGRFNSFFLISVIFLIDSYVFSIWVNRCYLGRACWFFIIVGVLSHLYFCLIYALLLSRKRK